jgi:hypothetical protein
MVTRTCKICEAKMKKGYLRTSVGPQSTEEITWFTKKGVYEVGHCLIQAFRCPKCGFVELWTATK